MALIYQGECDQDGNQPPADTYSMLGFVRQLGKMMPAMFSGHLSEASNNRKSTLKYISSHAIYYLVNVKNMVSRIRL